MADAASRIFNVMKRSGTDTVSELVHLKVKTVNPLTLILDDRVTLTEDFFELSKSINVANIHVDDILVGISLNGGQKYLIQENSNDETGGLPPGGFAGEVLSKESNDDFDVKWKNMSELSKVGDTLPIGSIIPYGSFTVPDNWLLCDGRAVSRTEYSFLYAAIGTLFGSGDGSTTFNLPNLQGRVPAGWKGSDADFGYMGGTGGEKTHKLTLDEMPSHDHSPTTAGHEARVGGWVWKSGVNDLFALTTSDYWESGYPIEKLSSEGGDQPHNNLQPYIVTNYIIKAKQSVGLVANVVDSLNSDSSSNALSAKQGKVLNENKIGKSEQYYGDLNDINDTYFCYAQTEVTNKPSGASNGYVFTQKLTDKYLLQRYTNVTGNLVWERNKFNGTWNEWEPRTTVAHQVWGVNLTPGNTITDSRIYLYGGAKQVILYYTANDNNYINSVVISREQNDWSMVLGYTSGVIVGYFIVNFASGIITSSQYTNASIRCVGYDIIK